MVGRARWAVVMAIGLAGLVTAPVAAAAPSTVRVSESSASAEANAGSGQGGVAVSADGRYVAFISDASNLVPGDANGVADVFVRDLRLHTTERVSVSTAGVEGDEASSADALAISPEGRYVTFTSDATNLAPGNDDTDCAPERCPDVYIRDRTAGTTRRLVPFEGAPTPVHMILSAAARFFAYDVPDVNELTRCRRSPRRCIEVGILPPSVQVDEADANPYLGGMSSGGRFILFRKIGFPEPPTVSAGGVFLRDVVSGTTHIVTVNPFDHANALSPQGRFALFTSRSSKLVPNDTNRRADVFMRDRRTGATHRISVSSERASGQREQLRHRHLEPRPLLPVLIDRHEPGRGRHQRGDRPVPARSPPRHDHPCRRVGERRAGQRPRSLLGALRRRPLGGVRLTRRRTSSWATRTPSATSSPAARCTDAVRPRATGG